MKASEARKLSAGPSKGDNSWWILDRIKRAAHDGKSRVEIESTYMTPVTRKVLQDLGYQIIFTDIDRKPIGKWFDVKTPICIVRW